ncbi:MAG: ribosomal-protein-alanine N-acetyltransferase [Methanomassiliicoccales archaeon PtaU1.Bin030]|nr:MAG: ribosomal-protein-alanine N-acetyltransferase [Methanomassiliicoccales archaeon PtaU1.Bin030]
MAGMGKGPGLITRARRRTQDLIGRISMIGFQDHKQRTRSFRKGDLERVLQIYRQNFDGGMEKMIEGYSSLFDDIFYIIEGPSKQVIGYCVCYMRLDLQGLRAHRVASIYSIAVDPAFQGQGLGNALLEDCIQDLRKNNVQRIRLYADVNNKPAVNLYLKHGFKITGTKENICGQGKTCNVMDLNLK